jgi:DNA-directed RNA polymerase subunit beta'
VIIDRVQRIYKTNGVTLDDKHLELLVRPIAFTQVVNDQSKETSRIQGEKHSLEVLERINYTRIVKNWKKKESCHNWEPRILYKPLLFGLTKGALHSTSFLSAASFQETSRILSRAAVEGRIDLLVGLKENLILGTRLPIGTSNRFFDLKTSFSSSPIPNSIKNIKKKHILYMKKYLL